ncbi:8093_t:CDS:2 [Acaulospora morrowiae]|uniref:8093_t:CDS:1 n=1 Tax=Acaulospora morrowiae TaxID=94023 RepID=A0A9N8VR04_9GLOM|nr:8093_t:CDS:2 [Acaulospora morrowiae]
MNEALIFYSPDYESDQYKLIELPPEVAKMYDDTRVQEATELPSLCIKAASYDKEPVLCTRNRTFVMRKQHYSDALLLLAPSIVDIDQPRHTNGDDMDIDENNNNDHQIKKRDGSPCSRKLEIIDTLGYLCELTLSVPKIEQLDELLSTTLYRGQEYERNYITDKMKFYTFEELEDIVQASTEELKHSLKKRNALEIEGHWRYIDSEYMSEVVKPCIMFADVYDMDIDHVSLMELCDIGKQYDFPDFIVKHVFTCLSESIDFVNESNSPIFKLSKEKIVQLFGTQLLRNNEKNNVNTTLTEFLEEWRKEIPIEHPVSFDLISDNVIIVKNSSSNGPQEEIVKYFPVSGLSSDPILRFDQLFLAKSVWREDHIRPFLVDFCLDFDNKFSLKRYNELIMKFTTILYVEGKIYRENGFIFYVSRWPH